MVSMRDIPAYGIILVAAGVMIGIGSSIFQSQVAAIPATTAANNATISLYGNLSSGMLNLSSQFGNIGLVLGLSAILLVLMGVLGMFGGREKQSR
jgi:hypothetical protein